MADPKKRLDSFVQVVVSQGASDLHLTVGNPPTIRVTGVITPMLSEPVLTQTDLEEFLGVILTEEQRKHFVQNKELDFSWEYGGKGRFRGNAFFQRGKIALALRLILPNIRTLAELNLPPVLETFAGRQQGFFLVVGPVGQGKSTTLAAMIDLINQTRQEHILTIEDPIEYLFENKQSIIDQREVGTDTNDFSSALNSVFREDVNVLMIGEMHSPETIATAVTAAETGHLVLSTLHTNNAAQTVDRIIDSFPAEQQAQIRTQLSASLAGIFSQRLVPRIAGGLVPVYELLIRTDAVSNLIREKRTHEIQAVIETGAQDGMIDMNRSLANLVRAGEITVETAYAHSLDPNVLQRLL